MIDTFARPPLTSSHPMPAYTSIVAAPPAGDELSDDDLEQVVGGLARARGASAGAATAIGSGVTVTLSSPAVRAQRISG